MIGKQYEAVIQFDSTVDIANAAAKFVSSIANDHFFGMFSGKSESFSIAFADRKLTVAGLSLHDKQEFNKFF